MNGKKAKALRRMMALSDNHKTKNDHGDSQESDVGDEVCYEDIDAIIAKQGAFSHLKKRGMDLTDKDFDRLWDAYRAKDHRPVWTIGFFCHFIHFVETRRQET